jgi:hypothetical protein
LCSVQYVRIKKTTSTDITKVRLAGSAGNFAAGTRATFYGIASWRLALLGRNQGISESRKVLIYAWQTLPSFSEDEVAVALNMIPAMSQFGGRPTRRVLLKGVTIITRLFKENVWRRYYDFATYAIHFIKKMRPSFLRQVL